MSEKIKEKSGKREQKNTCGQPQKKVIPVYQIHTRILYTLWLVNFDRFCQPSSVNEADEKCDMAVVRDFEWYIVQIYMYDKQHAKMFPPAWECLHEE